MTEISGIVRLQGGRARLHSEGTSVILVPYPAEAPLDDQQKEIGGTVIFSYLRNQRTTIVGDLYQGKLFNARVRAAVAAGTAKPVRS